MKLLKAISRTPLFKVTSLNGVSVMLRVGIGLITSKILAVFIGPTGMGLVGNLRNFLASLETIATLGFQNGIVKYVAENRDDEKALKKVCASVFYVLLLTAVLLSGVLYCFAEHWNALLFGNQNYTVLLHILALALPWYAASICLIAVINGMGKFKNVIYINMIGNMIGLVISVVLVMHFRTLGALAAIVLPPALTFFVSVYFINRDLSFLRSISFSDFDFSIIKGMASYSLMALVSSVCTPVIYIAIRNFVIETSGLESAGCIEALSRISTYYMLFISTILTVYFLPKLAFASSHKATRNVFWSYYSSILPVFGLGLTVLYFLRSFIVHTLFTANFEPVKDLFFWQLCGDFLKAASLILGYQFFAKKLTLAFICTEILSQLTLVLLSYWMISIHGVKGVVIAHTLTYAIYLAILMGYFRKTLF